MAFMGTRHSITDHYRENVRCTQPSRVYIVWGPVQNDVADGPLFGPTLTDRVDPFKGGRSHASPTGHESQDVWMLLPPLVLVQLGLMWELVMRENDR